jgi:transposase
MRRREQQCPRCKALERRLGALETIVSALTDENERLTEKVEQLEETLNQNASNSSKPPSSLPAEKKCKPSKPKSGRKRGAQPGHADQQRKLYPPDRVDKFQTCKPNRCSGCGERLVGDDEQPRREQQVELPEIKPLVTEFVIHTLTCSCCGGQTSGARPPGVSGSAFGPRIHALVSLLSGAYRLSKREIEQLMSDAFGVHMSLGSVCNLENSVSEALEAPVDEAKKFVTSQPVVHLDETGWREAKRKAWLWAAVTASVTVFVIRVSRGKDVAKELIGAAFEGVVNSDRWSAYLWLALKHRQLCWAHLKRNFQQLVDRGGTSARIGRKLLKATDQLFCYWHRVRDGTMQRSTFEKRMAKLQSEVFATLLVGATCRHKRTATFCTNLLALEPAMWTFVRVEGVDPTNNAAERAVRKPVLWRKGSFGTDSPRGSRFAERILTAVATLRSQQRNVLAYLTDATKAAVENKPAPSLLPNQALTA